MSYSQEIIVVMYEKLYPQKPQIYVWLGTAATLPIFVFFTSGLFCRQFVVERKNVQLLQFVKKKWLGFKDPI